MEKLLTVVQGILDLGPTVMLPIMITLLGLFFRMKPLRAIKAGMTVGIGFAGINLVVNLLFTSISPAVSFYETMGSGFNVLEIPWPVLGAAYWTAPFAPLVVPVGVSLNLLLVRMKLVKVINVDIWNYILILAPGTFVWALSGSFILGFLFSVILSVINLFAAQKFAPIWQEYFDLEGTTCTTMLYTVFVWPVTWLVNKIIDFIPGLNKLDIRMEALGERWNILGEPMFIGFFVGILLAILTKQPYTNVLSMGTGIAATMFLLPRMVSILMEGLSSIGTSVREYVSKRMDEETEILIGMDVALGLGDSCTISSSIISLPFIIALAFIIPGINFFPIGLLTLAPYYAVTTSAVSEGNLLRSVISILVVMSLAMIAGSIFAPEWTTTLARTGVEITGTVTSGDANPFYLLPMIISRFFAN